MRSEVRRGGYPFLAALLVVGIGGVVRAETSESERPEPLPVARSGEMELLKEEETVNTRQP
jgi:hypothetical protein